MTINSAKELKADINRIILNWGERAMFTLRGIANLSLSDFETLETYLETFQTYGSIDGRLEPLEGQLSEVWSRYRSTF